jgi:hypothetical protein
VSLGGRLARWQTWVTVGAALTPLLVVVDLALFERNRALQFELSSRQQVIQRSAQLETLHRELINAISSLAARSNDAALRAILAEQGIAPTAPAAPPAAAPGRGR